MKRRTWVMAGMALVLSGGIAGGYTLHKTRLLAEMQTATGFAALDICTRVMVSGDDYDRVVEDYVMQVTTPLHRVWRIDFQAGQSVSVQTRLPFLGYRKTALYRPGFGCTLVASDADARQVRAQALRALPPAESVPAPWPLGDGPVSPAAKPLAPHLVRNAEALFAETESELQARLNTIAVLVAKDGELVFERYAPGYHALQPQRSWSMTKSLTALIYGAMATDGLITWDEPAGLPEWKGTQKADITIGQLLNMASGLEWQENRDVGPTLFYGVDSAARVAAKPLVAEPGSHFNYSSGTSVVVMKALAQRLGGSQALYEYYQTRLLRPLGIQDAMVEMDHMGTPVGGSFGVMRPRDWLRLGQLVVNNGTWNGQQLISPLVMQQLLAPSPADPGYGGHIWRQPAWFIPKDVQARLPADLVCFSGSMGQFTVIVPSLNLVVVRMGVSLVRSRLIEDVFRFTAELVEAYQ